VNQIAHNLNTLAHHPSVHAEKLARAENMTSSPGFFSVATQGNSKWGFTREFACILPFTFA